MTAIGVLVPEEELTDPDEVDSPELDDVSSVDELDSSVEEAVAVVLAAVLDGLPGMVAALT